MNVALTGVRVRFGPVVALDGVDVGLRPGGVTVLVGPNGAGKSTLLAVLLGLVRPDAGELRVDGALLPFGRGGLPRGFRARLGYLPEAVAFAENLSGRQVLAFFARARGVPQARVGVMLERVGLAVAADRAVRGYSRGMRQRLGLGAALLGDPELLVLDEPTGGLDQAGLALLWEVLHDWRAAGRTVVLTTHDLALIERRSDELLVFAEGRVHARGSPDALRREAGLPVRLRLATHDEADRAPLADRLRTELAGVAIVDGQVVAEVAPDALHRVLHGIDVGRLAGVRVEEPGLDQVYDALLARGRGR